MDRLSFYAKRGEPFLFVIDFEVKNIFVETIKNLKDIYFDIDGVKNFKDFKIDKDIKIVKKYPISFERYNKAFLRVQEEIKKGNTYLLNLTFPTKIEINSTLKEIFFNSSAKFKLFFKDRFVCFSPERFIEIKDNIISTYPMKGTIDANIKDAKKRILNNEKEIKTARPITLFINALAECVNAGYKKEDVIELMKNKEWQTLNIDWVKKILTKKEDNTTWSNHGTDYDNSKEWK